MSEIFNKLEIKGNKLKANLDKIITKKKRLIENIQINYKKENIINILDNLDILNNDIECIINHIDKLNINIENDILTDCSDEINQLISNRIHTKKVLEPFLPYLLIYNLFT